MTTKGSLLNAMLLIAGCCIGGGMLAVPAATGVAGFVPSIFTMTIIWIFMTLTGLLLGEASMWLKGDAHMLTMSEKMLGPVGKSLCWVLYLFIGYASLVAYTAVGGIQIAELLHRCFSIELSRLYSCLIFTTLFGSIIYCGNLVVGRVNTLCFLGMIGFYVALIVIGAKEVDSDLLSYRDWGRGWLGVPLLLTAFSYQTMVPSITLYLDHDGKKLRIAIIGGTTIAFVVYLIWQWLILGIVSPEQLEQAFAEGKPVNLFLGQETKSSWIFPLGQGFAFFALVTSYFGIALGLFDFLADGFKIPKKGWGKLLLVGMVAIPTLFFAWKYERAFLQAMDLSGGFGDSILSGIMPVLIVWVGRYFMKLTGSRYILGGRAVLTCILLFYVGTLVFEIFSQIGYLCMTS